MDWMTGRRMVKQTKRRTDIQKDRQINRQTDRQTNRQTDRYTDRQGIVNHQFFSFSNDQCLKTYLRLGGLSRGSENEALKVQHLQRNFFLSARKKNWTCNWMLRVKFQSFYGLIELLQLMFLLLLFLLLWLMLLLLLLLLLSLLFW